MGGRHYILAVTFALCLGALLAHVYSSSEMPLTVTTQEVDRDVASLQTNSAGEASLLFGIEAVMRNEEKAKKSLPVPGKDSIANGILMASSVTELNDLYEQIRPFDFESKTLILSRAAQADISQIDDLEKISKAAFYASQPVSMDTPLDDRHLDHLTQSVDLIFTVARVRGMAGRYGDSLLADTAHPLLRKVILEKMSQYSSQE